MALAEQLLEASLSKFFLCEYNVFCCTVYPFKAVYAYTPSKLLTSVGGHLRRRPTEDVNDCQETGTKLKSSLSLSASVESTTGNGSLDHVESATATQQASSVSNGESFGTMVVYSRRTEGMNGSASLREDAAGSLAHFTPSGIRRSCSLDGVALASRSHGDECAVYGHGHVGRSRSDSSDDDWHSQGQISHS